MLTIGREHRLDQMTKNLSVAQKTTGNAAEKLPDKAFASRSKQADASLYFGKVMHARMKPVTHRFAYSVFSLLIDLDRLNEADKASYLFSVNKGNLISFKEKDHGKRDGSSLRVHVNELLAEAGMEAPHSVSLLCYPRIFGYTFNPLSVYYCRDERGELTALIYQVHNTFSQKHTYVAPVLQGEASKASVRQERNKLFYVSPFMDMDMRYHFRMTNPGEDLKMRILETDCGGPVLSATFYGKRQPLNGKVLGLGILQTLGLTWKVTAGIHFEALRLWFKGLRLTTRPSPPTLASYGDKAE